ncbi:MAG TPA: HK97 gp10 family phage protein [Gaiellaceae bacterium]|nr:HK97 gp10 family phage protein [Gaiellaceae bacterium]
MPARITTEVTTTLPSPRPSARVEAAIPAAVRRFLAEVAARARQHAAGAVLQPRTGTLARSIRVLVRQQGAGVVGRLRVSRRAFYAAWQEFGLEGPWEIRPRAARRREGHAALRFVSRAGQLTFAARVRHPGLRARHWLESAYRAVLPSARAHLEAAVREAFGA